MSGGRIRTIKPEVLDDERASALSDEAWRMWVSMWVLADDYGNLRASDRYLAANVWQDTTRDAAAPFDELVRVGLIVSYEDNGQRYCHISGWSKHQRIDNAGKPRVPAPPEINNLASVSPRTSASLREPGGLPPEFAAGPRPGPPTTDHREGPYARAREGSVLSEFVGEASPAPMRQTPPPPDIPITPAIRDSCRMAGRPEPTKAHVVACLAHARQKGKTSYDWGSELVSWVCRESTFGPPHGKAAVPEPARPRPVPCPFCQQTGRHAADCDNPLTRKASAR